MSGRIIALIDMDCFYVQVEEKENPEIKGHPAAVVTYSPWKGGGIIAVNYEARTFGIKRGMYGTEAKEKCPSIHLFQVPVQRNKTDLTKYRNAGRDVVSVLCEFSDYVEKASVDEAFIDLTEMVKSKMNAFKEPLCSQSLHSTWVVGYEDAINTEDDQEVLRLNGLKKWLSETYEDSEDMFDANPNENMQLYRKQLTIAAVLCENIRAAVLEKTEFKCSAGISHNKMLAKVVCALHKPNQQTICPLDSVPTLWATMPIGKVRNLGGKLGESLTKDFGCKTMSDLSNLELKQLKSRYEDKTAIWLHDLGRGVDAELVVPRQLIKSIGCGKNFMGKEALNTKEKVEKWMKVLSEELAERLEEDIASNKRRAKTLSVSVKIDGDDPRFGFSRSCPLTSFHAESIARTALSLIRHSNKASAKQNLWIPSIKNITLSAGKFEDLACGGTTSIEALFKRAAEKPGNLCNIKDTSEINENLISNISTLSKAPNMGIQSFFKKMVPAEHNEISLGENSSRNTFQLNPDRSSLQRETKNNENLDLLIKLLDAEEEDSDDQYNASTDSDQSIEIIENEESDKIEPNQGPSSLYRPISYDPNVPSSSKTKNQNACMQNNETDSVGGPAAISVEELFPDLNDVDESLLPLLPHNLRKRVKDALIVHKARQVGKSVLKKAGISKFFDEGSPKSDSSTVHLRNEARMSCESNAPLGADSPHLGLEEKDSNLNEPLGETAFTGKPTNIHQKENEIKVKCDKCSKEIASSKMNEHLDYHVALSLREEQFIEAQNRVSKNINLSSKRRESHRKRGKRKSTGPLNTCDKLPKIDSYFKK